jgi:signal transduction histidine kinase/ActR/RegA family two-component response regulator
MSIGSDNLTSAALSGTAGEPFQHTVQFYESDIFLVESVSRLIGDGIEAGEAGLIIATPSHREAIEACLLARGIDVPSLLIQNRFLSLDASETLAQFMADEYPNTAHFEDVIGKSVAGTTNASPRHHTRAFGEMVALLWADGKHDAALRLEELWNGLAKRVRFSLCCGYPLNGFSGVLGASHLNRVCGEHSEIIPAESYTSLATADARMRIIIDLQRKARLLESEMAVRRAVEEELRRKVADLAEADKRKNEFLAMLGHELRNPLSAVANAIATAHLNDNHRDRALDIARRQTGQLTRLVDDLLDIARIKQGRIALRKEVVNFASLIDRALEETRPIADAHRTEVAFSMAPETLSINVAADPARLQQVLSNLIHNAIKFSQPGNRVEMELLRRGDAATVRIRDWGIGIAPEMLPRVFDLFAQGDVLADRVYGGLGMGLTLVRQLVELHGGRVEAHSGGLGKGSEFVVSFPIVKTDRKVPETTDARPETSRHARVLIVEDNPDGAESMRMLLELLGHHVRVAADGFQALDMLVENTFDVILIDIGLPFMDGYALASHIRALPAARPMRLVALTGYGQDDDRRRALAAGFDLHLVKPVDVDRLQALLAVASDSLN